MKFPRAKPGEAIMLGLAKNKACEKWGDRCTGKSTADMKAHTGAGEGKVCDRNRFATRGFASGQRSQGSHRHPQGGASWSRLKRHAPEIGWCH